MSKEAYLWDLVLRDLVRKCLDLIECRLYLDDLIGRLDQHAGLRSIFTPSVLAALAKNYDAMKALLDDGRDLLHESEGERG